MKPFFNLLTESDGEGKEEGKEGRDEELQEFSVFETTFKIILLGFFSFLSFFFFPPPNVGTSFGPAERGIQL